MNEDKLTPEEEKQMQANIEALKNAKPEDLKPGVTAEQAHQMGNALQELVDSAK